MGARLARLAAALLLSCAGYAAAEPHDDTRLLAWLGVPELLSALPDSLRLHARSVDADEAARTNLARALEDALPVAVIRAEVLDALAAALDETSREELSALLADPELEALVAAQRLAADDAAQAELNAFRERLAERPAPPSRLGQVDAVLEGTHQVRFAVLVADAVGRCRDLILDRDPAPELRAVLRERRIRQLEEQLGALAREYALFALRRHSPERLDTLQERLENPRLQWLADLVENALEAALHCRVGD